MIPSMNTPEYIDRQFKRVLNRYHVPEALQEDLYQEVAIATLEINARHNFSKRYQQHTVISNCINYRVENFLKKEEQNTTKYIPYDAVEFCISAIMKAGIEDGIDAIAEELDEFLDAIPSIMQNVTPSEKRWSKRCEVFISVALEIDNIHLGHSGVSIKLGEALGVGRSRGAQVYNSLLRRLRHPSISKTLKYYLEAFNEIRDLEDMHK